MLLTPISGFETDIPEEGGVDLFGSIIDDGSFHADECAHHPGEEFGAEYQKATRSNQL
jgi:hypothetical protein